ncbi:MAG: Calx-beta domain-containing protein, partial [Dongiaceae bacterium]
TVSYTGAELATGQTVTISVATGGGFDGSLADATAGSDYTSLGTVLTFTSGATSQTVAVSTIDDTIVEGDEDFTVTLSNAGAGTIVASQANTIIEDDNDGSLLNWSIEGTSELTEGGTAEYTVSYTGAALAPGSTVTISVGTGTGFDGTLADAAAGSDFTALGTVLTFTGGGSTAKTVAVSTIDDTVVENDEDFTVTIANPTAGSIAASQANTVIGDDRDESLLNWSIAGSSEVTEGGAPGSYTVSYTGASLAPGQTVTISVGTGAGFDGSLTDATAGSDYTTLGTVLTFTSGATSQTVAVSTIEDTIVEGDEDFSVTLSNAGAGTIVTSQANTVIGDDGDAVVFNIAGTTSLDEGNTATYTVTYTGATLAPGQTATVSVATNSGFTSTLPDATAGSDFTALGTVLTFTGGGVTSRTVSVSTVDDTIIEGDEDYTVRLSAPTNGTLGVSQANTIIEDSNLDPVVAPELCVWVPDATAQMTGAYANGYPLLIAAPTDPNGDTLTISGFTLPASGTIWYQPGGVGAFVQLTGAHTLTLAELPTLTYKPDGDGVEDTGTFSYTVDDGNGGSATGTVNLHDVTQIELEVPSGTIGSRTGNKPLNSGTGPTITFEATQEIIDAVSADDGRVKVATDFQIAPFDIPILVGERPAALAALQAQVSITLIIAGVTFNVVVAGGDNIEFWAIDNNPDSTTFGVWVAFVPADQILNAADSNETLEEYLDANPPTAGTDWTINYVDNTGGNEQARFAEFSFGVTSDTLLGGIHLDALNSDCADEPNLIYGTTLGDTLIGGNANDRIFGREGDDILAGGAGDDSLDGGADDDTLMGGEGNDTVLGGAGLGDLIDWSDATAAITHTLVTSGAFTSATIAGLGTDHYSGIEGIVGGVHADNLTGNASENILIGNEGNDTLSGADGSDTIRGGDNDDSIMGGNQNDLLLGDDGNDTIVGGAGDDTVVGDIGNDLILGGSGADLIGGDAGDDTIRFSDADNDSIDGAAGIDVLLLDQLSLNFDNVSDGQVTGIEILDLGRTDGVSRAVTLDAQDVLDFEASTGVSVDPDAGGGLGVDIIDLVVQGQAGDSVTLDGTGGGNPNWSTGVTAQALAGYAGTYSIFYATDGTVVAIEDAVSVAIVN